MTVNVKLADGSVVTGELIRKERVKVEDRTFQVAESCPTAWKGKQRQIVVDILKSDKDRAWTLTEIVTLANEKGLTAVGGVTDSVKYHLHQLVLLGHIA